MYAVHKKFIEEKFARYDSYVTGEEEDGIARQPDRVRRSIRKKPIPKKEIQYVSVYNDNPHLE
jgi:hypothetical protein